MWFFLGKCNKMSIVILRNRKSDSTGHEMATLLGTRAETDSNFYYPDILDTIFPDILRIVTSSIAVEKLYFWS